MSVSDPESPATREPPSRPADRVRRNSPITGAGYLFRGLGLLRVKGLRSYVIIPLLVNVILFAGAIWWTVAQFGELRALLEGWLPDWLDFISWILLPLFFLAGLLVVFFGFSLLANLIAAPFNGLLAEAAERVLAARRGEHFVGSEFRWRDLGHEVARSFSSELRKLAYVLPRLLGLVILSLIPILNVASPFLWFAFSAWIMAIGYLDYPMANHGLGFREQRRLVRTSGALLPALGFGTAVTLGFMIPLVNLIVMPAAVAGATVMWSERLSREVR